MWKVLLVEDEVFVRESIREIIEWEKWGFEVIGEAGNGVEALEIMKKDPPHLIITDIVMPEMDGIELLKQSRAAGYNTKFVMLTCMNDLEYAIQAMEYGASSYILKLSMNVSDLRNTLNKISSELNDQLKMEEDKKLLSVHKNNDYLSWEHEKEFLQAFERKNIERSQHILEEIWKGFEKRGVTLSIVKAISEKLAATCHRIALQDDVDVENINDIPSINGLLVYLKDKVYQLVTRMAKQSGELTSHPEINKIIAYIHQSFEQDITVKSMARYVIMSENYVSSLFRQKTGKTLISYLHEVRIKHAKHYLKTTDLPVNEIGHLVGFANDNYFIRIFKRFTKLTPSQYRETILKT